MERNSHNENKTTSRFSGEERARMTDENSYARKELKKQRAEAEKSERKNNSKQNKGSNRKKDSKSEFKGSRNDRVKTSTAERKKNRKKQSVFLAVMLFAVTIAVIAALSVAVLRINSIEVINTQRYTENEVLSVAKIKEGGSMLLFSTDNIGEKLETSLPYIENAEVKRVWPDKVIIEIQDSVATLAIDTGNGYILMNDSCKVLDNNSQFLVNSAAIVKGVVPLESIPGKTVKLDGQINTDDFVKLIKALNDSGIQNVSYYDLSNVSNIVICVNRRIEIHLGTLAGADAKLLKFASRVVEETEATDKTHEIIIDLTVDGEARVRQKNTNEVIYEEESTKGDIYG